jgi:glucosyl-3-phosphoglycerate synthase
VLHRLGQPNVDQLEQELARYGRVNPIALVLPSLYAELGHPALKAIVDILKTVSYLNEIVISLDRASALEFRPGTARTPGADRASLHSMGIRFLC